MLIGLIPIFAAFNPVQPLVDWYTMKCTVESMTIDGRKILWNCGCFRFWIFSQYQNWLALITMGLSGIFLDHRTAVLFDSYFRFEDPRPTDYGPIRWFQANAQLPPLTKMWNLIKCIFTCGLAWPWAYVMELTDQLNRQRIGPYRIVMSKDFTPENLFIEWRRCWFGYHIGGNPDDFDITAWIDSHLVVCEFIREKY